MAEIQLQRVNKSYDGKTMAVRDLDLHCPQGEMLALLGPSGCGKSSTLKMVAGIETISSGAILFDGVDVSHQGSAGRNVAMVFEDYSLYPHMSTYDNIAFPLRIRGTPHKNLKKRVDGVVAMLGLADLLAEPVRALSGGAQQRVSIGRALVRDPALVMFDEPLSHLDADQKVMLRTEIRRLQTTAGLTSVLVTHDQTEAMAMADRIAVMSQGLLQQVGSPETLYHAPANLFVAGFIGESPMNFFPALRAGGQLALRDLPASALALGRLGLQVDAQDITLGIRPEDIVIGAAATDTDALQLSVRVLDRECCGDRDVLRVAAGEVVFHIEQPAPCAARPGDVLPCGLPLARLHAFDTATGGSLGARRLAC